MSETSSSAPLPTLKEKYATVIVEATASAFRGKKYIAKIVRRTLTCIFPLHELLPVTPHVREVVLVFDAKFTSDLDETVMDIIDHKMFRIAKEVVENILGQFIAQYAVYKHRAIPDNIWLNTTDHIAHVINQAVIDFHTNCLEEGNTFFQGYEDSDDTFIDNFTDDFFQEYLSRHDNFMARGMREEVDKDLDFKDEEDDHTWKMSKYYEAILLSNISKKRTPFYSEQNAKHNINLPS